MRCDEFAMVQTALVEGCSDGDERLHAEAHVAVCAPCAARLEREQAVKSAVGAAVDPAPTGLRRAVTAAVVGRTPTAVSGRGRAAAVSSAHRPFRRAGAAVGCLALLSAATLLVVGPRSAGDGSVMARIEADYEKPWPATNDGPVPPGLPDLAPRGLDRWVTGRFRVPGGTASAVRYTGAGGRIAVYRVAGALPPPPGALLTEAPVPSGTSAWTQQTGEYTVLVWTDGSGTVVMVGTLDRAELAQLAAGFA